MSKQTAVYFVTSNDQKFKSLQAQLAEAGTELKRLSYDFDEGRSLDIKTVAGVKLAQAKAAFPGKKLIVDDRGFFIPALCGFPGPFVKVLLESFSYKGLIKLMKGEADRRAYFSFAAAYFDGQTDHVFVADEEGFITDRPKGNDLHGWTELLYVYGHPTFPGKSLAQLSGPQWRHYLQSIEDTDPFSLLKEHFLRSR
jgi:XTP/dITP diphosphohydrolase